MCARSCTSDRSGAQDAGRPANSWPSKDIEERRSEQDADEDLAEDRWLVDARGQRASQLGGGDDQHQQQNDLKRMRHRR